MARDAAAVLAALIGAADDDVFDLVGGEPALRDDLGDDFGEHVVGPQSGERAGVASKGAAQAGVEISLEHGSTPPSMPHSRAPAPRCQAPAKQCPQGCETRGSHRAPQGTRLRARIARRVARVKLLPIK